MDQITRKLMTMHKALHSRDDVERLDVSRKEGRRRLARIEDRIHSSVQRLDVYREKRGGRLIAATRNNTNDMRTSGTTITRTQKWEEKQLYGGFKRLTSYIFHEKAWTLLRKGNLKRERESLPIAARNNDIMTNHLKEKIDKTQQNSRCRLCVEREEAINHTISE